MALRNYKALFVRDLIKYKSNSRTHSPEQIDKIVRSINEFGFTNPLLIDENNTIIAGHGRLDAAVKCGLDEVPCIIIDGLTDAQKAALVIADNKIALDAGWDLGILQEQFEFLKDSDYDLTLTGFGIEEICEIFPADDPEVFCGEDDVPDAVEPVTVPGDLWMLGDHRLLCGDSTVATDVERLLDGCRVDMVFTDPPYGVNERTNRFSNGRGKLAKGKDFDKVIGDDSTQTAIDVINLCVGLNIEVLLFWGANYFAHALPEVSSWIIWDKRDGCSSDDNADCELAWTNTRKPARLFSHLWKGCIKASERQESRIHPTQKPIALAEWCISELNQKGNKVLDLFGGSGSTLIACEKLKRKCFMMELDPKYCDIIIQRYENYTGKKAIKEEL